MYGLVNKAIEQMVCSGHGTDTWERIKREAGLEIEGFISNEPYPDDVTYRLVAAASTVLGIPPSEILKSFGEHWVLHTALESYGPLMRSAGNTLKDFLLYLPRFHTRVEAIYPRLTPPEFSYENVHAHGLDLRYWSPRPAGLEPFVEGLIHGLAKMFATPVQVELLRHRADGHEFSVFRIRWAEPA